MWVRWFTLSSRVAQPAGDGVHAEIQPFAEDGFQVFLARPAVQAQHHQIHRHIAFQAGLRQQQGDEFVRILPAGFGFEHQPHRLLLVGFVAHPVQLAQHQALEVLLLGRQRFLPGRTLGLVSSSISASTFAPRCPAAVR